MSGSKYVIKLEIKARCVSDTRNRVNEVKLEFDDGSFQMVITIHLVVIIIIRYS